MSKRRRRRASDDDACQAWFELTWKDREDALWERYGPSHPSGSAPGFVTALPMPLRLERPGLCVQTFPPVSGTGERRSRTTWTYATNGLTHPLEEGAAAPGSWELGLETSEASPWALGVLQLLAAEVVEGVEYGLGHRVAAFVRRGADLIPYLGHPEQHAVEAWGAMRWLLLFPHLRPWGRIPCSTGSTGVLVGTAITQDEFELLDDVDRDGTHVQLLLCERGVGQLSSPERASVVADRQGCAAWERIRALSPEEAYREVVTRFTTLHGDERWPFDDPKNVATITVRSILEGEADIVQVSHDAEDGGWQFLDGRDVREEDARVVSLAEMLRRAPTIAEVARLPKGWVATRERAGAQWQWSDRADET